MARTVDFRGGKLKKKIKYTLQMFYWFYSGTKMFFYKDDYLEEWCILKSIFRNLKK